MKLSAAQIKGLKMVAKRDWPAGEPRKGWLNAATERVLYARGLIVDRPGSTVKYATWENAPIIDLTDSGRAALASAS